MEKPATLDVIIEDFDKEICALEGGYPKHVYDLAMSYIGYAYREGTKNPGNLI